MKNNFFLFLIICISFLIVGASIDKIKDQKPKEAPHINQIEQQPQNISQPGNEDKTEENNLPEPEDLSAEELDYLVQFENQFYQVTQMNVDENKQRESKSYQDKYPDLYVENLVPLESYNNGNVAYLTFDDGPSRNTEKILDILDEYGIKASFFVIGSDISDTGEKCLKRMAKDGHTIGIHAYQHKAKRIYNSVDSYLDDFYLAYRRVYEIAQVDISLYRFPWGSYNGYLKPIKKELITEMERRGFTFVDWNVSGEDAIGCPTKCSILNSINKDLDRYQQPVILLHDAPSCELTVKLLPDIIEMLLEKGYEFGTVSEREACQFRW